MKNVSFAFLGKARGTSWEEERCIQGWGNQRERTDLENLGINGRILLKWLFKKWDGGITDPSGSGQGQVADTCECGNEPSGSIKRREFLQ